MRAPEIRAKREEIVAHLARLIQRRRSVQRQLTVEALAAIAGATACVAARNLSVGASSTAALASLSCLLAARDHRRSHRLRGQIASLTRVVAAFV